MTLKQQLNHYGSLKEPFLFIIDFDIKNYEVIPLKNIKDDIFYSFDNKISNKYITDKSIIKTPIDKNIYNNQFENIQKEIREGNTYLINLTSKTNIDTKLSLKEIYQHSNGRFKLYYKDKFVSFSPERFVKISDNKIYTFPMKGTIDASLPNAKQKVINNPKELAEHTMVVDLLRNDLSIVSKKVRVDNFRYCEKIKAGDKELIQVSSQISGDLNENWHKNIADIILPLLPAGSITGTPKKKTVEIIKENENFDRGYFTGIFGIFDGKSLDSSVLIRFIEKQDDGSLIYKSGGGITCDSSMDEEYQEMCDKVYIP